MAAGAAVRLFGGRFGRAACFLFDLAGFRFVADWVFLADVSASGFSRFLSIVKRLLTGPDVVGVRVLGPIERVRPGFGVTPPGCFAPYEEGPPVPGPVGIWLFVVDPRVESWARMS